MNRVLLDTSAYIASVRGHPNIQRCLTEAHTIYVSPIVLGELRAGFLRGSRVTQNEAQLTRFLDLPGTNVLNIDDETSVRYAEIRHFLRRQGTPVGENDLWIAASAMQHGLALLTTDTDFQKLPQILVQHFPPANTPA